MPGQKAVEIAKIEDVNWLLEIVQGTDGRLYLFGDNNALKDGKWLVSGELQFSVVDIDGLRGEADCMTNQSSLLAGQIKSTEAHCCP